MGGWKIGVLVIASLYVAARVALRYYFPSDR
jgi:hypothetical protein